MSHLTSVFLCNESLNDLAQNAPTTVQNKESSENLTTEQRYMLSHCTRQEPQGGEDGRQDPGTTSPAKRRHRQKQNSVGSTDSESKYNTLIIHDSFDATNDNCTRIIVNSGGTSAAIVPPSPRISPGRNVPTSYVAPTYHTPDKSVPPYHTPPSYDKKYYQQYDQSEILRHLAKEVQDGNIAEAVPYYEHFGLALPPPPDYPGGEKGYRLSGSQFGAKGTCDKGRASLDASQIGSAVEKDILGAGDLGEEQSRWADEGPALIKAAAAAVSHRPQFVRMRHGTGSGDQGSVDLTADRNKGLDSTSPAVEIVELLSAENARLKSELDTHYRKASKVEKLELELMKVQDSHNGLVSSSEKRERLERAVRTKLDAEVRRTQGVNKMLKEQLDSATSQILKQQQLYLLGNSVSCAVNTSGSSSTSTDLCATGLHGGSDLIHKSNQLISQLLQQNRELQAAKKRQEIELAAQRATLHEQRQHIDILDTALTNSQSNVVKLEEDCRKKQAYVDRVAQLQSALASLQAASDKREQMEKRLRIQLEREIQELRRMIPANANNQHHKKDDSVSSMSKRLNRLSGGGLSANDSGDGACLDASRMLREKDERIMGLEAEVAKWERMYSEEAALRQLAIDAASMPKDARIAALERSTHESERVIQMARTDKIRQMEEVHSANKKCTDYEAKIRTLESKIAERDAMIKVLQKHSIEKDRVLHSAMLNHHHDMKPPCPTQLTPSSTASSYLHHSQAASVPTSAAAAHGQGCCTSSAGVQYHGRTVSVSAATANLPISTLSRTWSEVSLVSACDVRGKDGGGGGMGGSKLYSNKKASRYLSGTAQGGGAVGGGMGALNSLDQHLKELDAKMSKDSIIRALRQEKEKFPGHFWQV